MSSKITANPIEFKVDQALAEKREKYPELDDELTYSAYMTAIQRWMKGNRGYVKELILDYWYGPAASKEEGDFIDGLSMYLVTHLHDEFVPWKRPGVRSEG